MPTTIGPGGLVDDKCSCRSEEDFPRPTVHLSYARSSIEIEYDQGASHHVELFDLGECRDLAMQMDSAIENEDWGEHEDGPVRFWIDPEDDGSFELRIMGLEDPGLRLLFADLEAIESFVNKLLSLVHC